LGTKCFQKSTDFAKIFEKEGLWIPWGIVDPCRRDNLQHDRFQVCLGINPI
jgi:hypothetical protein